MGENYIITGAAMGFGKEFSRRVLESGGRVVLADKNLTAGEVSVERWLIRYSFRISLPGDDQRVKGEVWRAEVHLLWAGRYWQVRWGDLSLLVDVSFNQDSMFRGSWRQMWDKAAEFLDDKIDVLVNNAGVSPKLGYDICMKVMSSPANKNKFPNILTD